MRSSSPLLVALFAGFVGAPGVAWIAGVEGGGVGLQNRALHQRPPLTFTAVSDASWGRQFSDWVWDAIPLRDRALAMHHAIDYGVFRDSPTKLAFFGLNGFSWRRERILEGLRAGGGNARDVHRALDTIERAFAEAGIPVHIVLSPTKASIYPEFLPPAYRRAYEKIARPVERVYRERAARDPVLIDLWTPFLAEKARLLGATNLAHPELMYLWRRNDDHWNIEAGRIQARAIVNAVEPGLWREENAPHFTGEFEELESELSLLYFKLGITEPYQGQRPSPNVAVKVTRKRALGSTNAIAISTSEKTPNNTPADLTLLVVRDSFLSEHNGAPYRALDAGVQTIAPFFRRAVFMHWETLQNAPESARLRVRGVDRVVIQVTQGSNYYLVKRAAQLVNLARMIREGRGLVDDGTDPLDVATRKVAKDAPIAPEIEAGE